MSTESQILLTAERLFATQGIDATSLRQISTSAGQRNTAAAQYHFTNKQKLIGSIFQYRREVIEARRQELLDTAAAEHQDADPWHLVETLVRPLAEQATRPGSHYVRFLKRVFEYARHDVSLLAKVGGMDEAPAIGRLLSDQIPSLAASSAHTRPRWAGQLIIAALADLEQRCAAADPAQHDTAQDDTAQDDTAQDDTAQEEAAHRRGSSEEFALSLIDAVTGLLTAPASTSSTEPSTAVAATETGQQQRS